MLDYKECSDEQFKKAMKLFWHLTKVKRDELGAELERRGMVVMY